MKKDLIFTPILLLVGALLFLCDFVGMAAHIAVAIIGVLVLAVYTSATKKDWKLLPLEILMRVFYGLALITGIVLLNMSTVFPLWLVHAAFATLFVLLLVILFVHKWIVKNRK